MPALSWCGIRDYQVIRLTRSRLKICGNLVAVLVRKQCLSPCGTKTKALSCNNLEIPELCFTRRRSQVQVMYRPFLTLKILSLYCSMESIGGTPFLRKHQQFNEMSDLKCLSFLKGRYTHHAIVVSAPCVVTFLIF